MKHYSTITLEITGRECINGDHRQARGDPQDTRFHSLAIQLLPQYTDALDPKMGLVADGFIHPQGRRWLVALALIIIFATFYSYFVPLVYGTPMSASAFEARMWFKTWE